ncbi:MAG: MGMT family protein [Bacteroidia bacterium]|nr:MGMT family protein [Bacteroidia bacterium]
MKKKLSNKIQDPLLDNKSGFFEKVYEVARQVPYGRVTSYGAIAKFLGSAKSARMVGWAMNQTHGLKNVPAHRVVNRIGLLTGKHHFSSENEMEILLKNEGIEIINDKITNFNKHFWDPCKELI